MNTTDQATTALNGCVSCNLIFATPTEVIGHVLTAHTARREGSTMDSKDSKSLADHARAAERTVVKLGRVLEPHRDATQSYVLDCGHVAI
jgi:hypothetical protein